MKKILLIIFGILLGFVGFSSACLIFEYYGQGNTVDSIGDSCITLNNSDSLYYIYVDDFGPSCYIHNGDSDVYLSQVGFFAFTGLTTYCCGEDAVEFGDDFITYFVTDSCNDLGGGGVSSSDITVFYDYGHSSTNIACNGDNSIYINGLSNYSGVTFSPYFNINYVDQDNQIITESYNKDMLYLIDGKFHKSYTGDNQWILSVVNDGDTSFTGYLPTFDVTGNITELDTGNVFNNFAENSLSVLLSNIPNYIQYVIMFLLLLFVLGIFRKLR